MLPLSIKFQCYIPSSLGKPLSDYFTSHPNFNDLTNKEEFASKLRAKDFHGYTWLPEPGSFITDKYFATDNVDMHSSGDTEHTIRLGFNAKIDPNKIGQYKVGDQIFEHQEHGDGWGGHGSQHSGESHQVQAYIKREATGYIDTGTTFIESGHKYVGICSDEISTLRSEEEPMDVTIKNTISRSYFHAPGTKIDNDTSIFKISASAGYPFAEPFSPNIDFEVEVKVIKNVGGNNVTVQVSGWHNDFPAYELVIGKKIIYTHNPSKYGYTGPGFGNLTKSRTFQASLNVHFSDWKKSGSYNRKLFGR